MLDGVGEHAVGVDDVLVALARGPHVKIGDLRQQHGRQPRRKISERLLAGISTISRRAEAVRRGAAPRPPRDRARPRPGCAAAGRGRRPRCSAPCAGRRGDRVRRDRAGRPLGSSAAGAGDQAGRRRPGRDVDHVACRASRRPARPAMPSIAHRAPAAGRTLARPSRRAPSRRCWRGPSLSGSLGWKVRSGRAAAKCMTCSPEPLATSSTRPASGRCAAQHIEDRLAVARRGGRVAPHRAACMACQTCGRRGRPVEVLHAERRQRIEDGVGDGGKGRDRARLAAALHAQRIGRAAACALKPRSNDGRSSARGMA